ncbi:hypothetical protein HMPREF9192_1360 [Streptococcus vestibularis F0396]|uniref:Uncharacterized protein n=1 Tax=Streptococcus vestibularis F0396 TaxID=904306 RepID=E3CQA4_STRVE|nr:hypothetical protein HMPREF9192_1360 [Streptococcus vestibularis F0396]
MKTLSIVLTDFLQKNERDPLLLAKVKKAISNIGLSFHVFMIIHRLQPIRLKKLNESK